LPPGPPRFLPGPFAAHWQRSNPDDQWSCNSVARGNEFMSEWDRLGERGIAQQAIDSSGESVAELSRKFSERMEKMGREAAASEQTERAPAQP
jgi:hypothetical protein